MYGVYSVYSVQYSVQYSVYRGEYVAENLNLLVVESLKIGLTAMKQFV